MRQISIVDYAKENAITTARIRAHLKVQGLPIGPVDLLLAGVALRRDLIFVTSNTREFHRIPHLHIEDWRT